MNPQNLQIPQEVRGYLESLFLDSGMSITDEEMKEEMIKELFARLDNYITSVIIDNLPPEHLEIFTKMTEEGKTQQETEQFLKDKIPNSQEVFKKAFMDFRDLYLGNVAAAKNVPENPEETSKNHAEENGSGINNQG